MRIKAIFQFCRSMMTVLLGLLLVSLGHATAVSTSSMPSMDGFGNHAQASAQCQASCISALPANKQDGLTQLERDDEAPKPAVSVYATVILSFIALTFVVKLLILLSSWRPPDLVRLYGQHIFYA